VARKREGRAQKEKRGPPGSEAGNVIETHEHKGDFKEPCVLFSGIGRQVFGNVSGLDGIILYKSR